MEIIDKNKIYDVIENIIKKNEGRRVTDSNVLDQMVEGIYELINRKSCYGKLDKDTMCECDELDDCLRESGIITEDF